MRIVAIFNVWADCLCLLPYAIDNIRPVVDDVILVWSKKSNRGQVIDYELPKGCINVQCEPYGNAPHISEISKRNAGLIEARERGFTHFIMMDADEFYEQAEFKKEKMIVEDLRLNGTVCRVKSYFKSPTLTLGFDHTLVPSIHRITPELRYQLNFKGYPFAVDKEGHSHIDPTRRLNITKGVRMSGMTMHHYSYVRKNMSLKLENSSANFKGKRGEIIYEDLMNAKLGYFCKGFQRELIKCENVFNLPVNL